LSLYSIPSQEFLATKEVVYPTITYNLPKRAKCLAFGTVPSLSSSAPNCHVIITGDLAGDAIAYPVPINKCLASAMSTNPTMAAATTRRLLLGHTASILTGLNLVPSSDSTTTKSLNDVPQKQQHQFILTADRDEKIRVSHFPETYMIHGYLLGHSSFISSMDAASSCQEDSDSQKRTLCITGSGDGTVRLWDYQVCKEVGMVPVMMKKCPADENNLEDTKMSAEDDEEEEDEDDIVNDYEEEEEKDDYEDEGDFDEDFSDDDEDIDGHEIAVPISLALSPNGESAVVVRDGIPSIDIHPIPTASSSQPILSLHKKVTLDCPSQPLAVKFLRDGSVLVLGRSPNYLVHFQCCSSAGTDRVESFNDASSTSPFCMALKDAIGSIHIDMPETTLERMWNKTNDPENERGEDGNDGEDQTQQNKKRVDLHWNDARRKEIDKLAQHRRKKKRRENRKMKKDEEVEN
jgi:tRNA (guanine-N(7)-)-methyltransferase subunit TRM82